jgi:hypothetical protein
MPTIEPGYYDLIFAYDWVYDQPFVTLLNQQMHEAGLRLATIDQALLPAALELVLAGQLTAGAFLDRASDTSPDFRPLQDWAVTHVQLVLNPPERCRHIWIKTHLHWRFIEAGLHAPYTLTVASYARQPELDKALDLEKLGRPFSIKPDWGGGGYGVVTQAYGLEDLLQARRELPNDDLILQEHIEPVIIGGKRAWFRVLHAFGEIFPLWWDDQTRRFGDLIDAQMANALKLSPLWEISSKAAEISGIDLFSTEVALTADGRFVVVDYVNDPVDLRFQPNAHEGMPQSVASAIAAALSRKVRPKAAGQ